jgi:putative intracellular protease/amidase
MSKRLALFLSILSVGACATRLPAPLPPSVLVVLSSVERLQDAPNATGNYLREVAYPVRRLLDAGYAVDFASPNGGAALVLGNTAYGLPDDRPRNPVLAEFDRSRLRDGRLDTLAPAEVDAARYAAVFYAGSLGGLVDLAHDERIAAIAAEVYGRGGLLAASGHGSVAFAAIPGMQGGSLVAGRQVASFLRSEDLAFFVDVLGWVGVLPYHVEDRLRAAGAVIASGPERSATVVEDGRLLSGQNAAAVDALSRRLVERLRAQGVVPVR